HRGRDPGRRARRRRARGAARRLRDRDRHLFRPPARPRLAHRHDGLQRAQGRRAHDARGPRAGAAPPYRRPRGRRRRSRGRRVPGSRRMTAATAHPRIGSVAPDAFASAARRIMGRCDDLARISAGEGRSTRVYLSPEHARVNQVVAVWMREVGMTARTDAAGNLTGVLPAADPDAPVVMLGSHLDTVTDAGRYDGILGVLLGIEVVRLLRERAADGGWQSPFPFGLEVAAFSDEEGTRFGKALLGSSAVAGAWEDGWWDLTDADGITLREAYR